MWIEGKGAEAVIHTISPANSEKLFPRRVIRAVRGFKEQERQDFINRLEQLEDMFYQEFDENPKQYRKNSVKGEVAPAGFFVSDDYSQAGIISGLMSVPIRWRLDYICALDECFE